MIVESAQNWRVQCGGECYDFSCSPDREMQMNVKICPLCNSSNDCGAANGMDSCWCFDMKISQGTLALIPDFAKDKVCICRKCAARSDRPSDG